MCVCVLDKIVKLNILVMCSNWKIFVYTFKGRRIVRAPFPTLHAVYSMQTYGIIIECARICYICYIWITNLNIKPKYNTLAAAVAILSIQSTAFILP